MVKIISQVAFEVVLAFSLGGCGSSRPSGSSSSITQYIEIWNDNGTSQRIMASGVSDVTYLGNNEARIVLRDGRQIVDHNAFPHKYDYLLSGKANYDQPGP